MDEYARAQTRSSRAWLSFGGTLAVLLLGSAACRGEASDDASGHAEISAVWAQIDATWNARDAKAFSRLFAEDVSFTFVGRKQSLDGRATILEHFAERFPRFAPDLRHRTRISAVDAIAPGVYATDGTVEILRVTGADDESPEVVRTFAIFALMSAKDEDWSIRALRIYEMPLGADDGA